ncbi:MAG: 50S ribosomal protein L24 [Candidatus Levybacteria bacterium]|nr:50S ribosomal protein L24 [Candidatus Levybacteria bacterium]
MKLKSGDTVSIVRGKDNGKQGTVQKIFTKEAKVLVEGINQYKRHLKSRTPGQKSEIITITKPLSLANVQLICPKCKKTTRVGYKLLKDDKVRVCKKCQTEL